MAAPVSGLGGWDWGVLRLHNLPVDPATALLGTPGSGLAIFHQHFAGFRPLVAGTLACCHPSQTTTNPFSR